MNETRSTHSRGRTRAGLAAVLCLMMAIGLLPLAAFAAPKSASDVEATYLNSADITLSATGATKTFCTLDGGAVVETTTASTGVYGPHVLCFWSKDASGNVEPTITAPFFVDDDVVPAVECDVDSSSVLEADIELTATDNFNGSTIDALFYRIDGGAFKQIVSEDAEDAANVFMSRLPKALAARITIASAVDPSLPVPGDHPVGAKTPDQCVLCHDLIDPTPEPTSTPDPTSTPAPEGTVHKDVTVEGVGSHTIEYWAMDMARNVSEHVTQTFDITKQPTKLSIYRNHSSLKRYSSVRVYGYLKPGLPASTDVKVQARKPGSSKWVTLSTRHTSATGAYTYTYQVRTKGSYYFRTVYAGSATFGSKMSSSVKVSVK